MAQNSYIKDLAKYPVGGSAIYTSTEDCVTITNSSGLGFSADGTGLNELWKFRSQFTLPSVISSPSCASAGRAVLDTTKISEIANYYAINIANTTLTGSSPYSVSQLRGAETFFVQFISGTAESPPSKTNACSCKFTNPICCIKLAWCWAQGVFHELGDRNHCFNWVYFNDSSFSIQIHGGYGSTGQFNVTLTNPSMGTIASTAATTLFTEGTTITYNIPRASNSGQGGFNVGEYVLTVTDVVTNVSLVVYVFVPLRTAPAPNNIFRMRNKFFSQTFTSGTTFCANNDNSIWIMPLPKAPTLPTAILVEPALSAIDVAVSCTSPPRTITTFSAVIDENTTDVTYTFQQRIAPATTWTNVAAAATILAADISLYQQPVSARLDTSVAALTGEWRLVLTNSVGTVALTAEPFNLDVPIVDAQHDAMIKSTGTPVPGVPGANSFTITQNITSQSCTNFSLSVLQWNSDQSATFAAAPTSIPTGFITPPSTFSHTGRVAEYIDTFTTTVRDDVSTTYTFLIIGQNTTAPYDVTIYPDTYVTAAVILPNPPGGTIPATNAFSVITVP